MKFHHHLEYISITYDPKSNADWSLEINLGLRTDSINLSHFFLIPSFVNLSTFCFGEL